MSIDAISLDDVEIVSGGRTLRGNIQMAVSGRRLDIRRADFTADDTPISVTGRIDDPAGPTGELTIRGASLDVLRLVSFASDFSAAGMPSDAKPSGPSTPDAVPMNLRLSLETERAVLGTLVLEALTGTARITDEAVTLDPIAFGAFGGKAKGSLALTLANTPGFALNAQLSGIDLGALTKFAGHPDLMTGRFGGRIDVSGRGTTAGLVMQSTTGTARIDATDGSVKGLGLVRAVVLAGSMRADSQAQASSASSVEPFTRMGATLTLAGGTASTRDLRFESKDLLFDAGGTFRLDGSTRRPRRQSTVVRRADGPGRPRPRSIHRRPRPCHVARIRWRLGGQTSGAHRRRRCGEAGDHQSRQRGDQEGARGALQAIDALTICYWLLAIGYCIGLLAAIGYCDRPSREIDTITNDSMQ